jgi:hypothetical protein
MTDMDVPTIDEIAKVTSWVVKVREILKIDKTPDDILAQEMINALTQYRQQMRPKEGWTLVSERLPEYRQFTLVSDSRGNIVMGLRGNLGWYIDGKLLLDITHWMPLPEPPQCGADMKGGE